MTSVLIVGAGLVGTSLGLALTRAGMDVFLEDKKSSHAKVAASLGAGRVAQLGPDDVRDIYNTRIYLELEVLRRLRVAAGLD